MKTLLSVSALLLLVSVATPSQAVPTNCNQEQKNIYGDGTGARPRGAHTAPVGVQASVAPLFTPREGAATGAALVIAGVAVLLRQRRRRRTPPDA